MAPCRTSMRAASPARCPSVRDRPRSLAQRPLPSMTIATCAGTRAAGMAGGVAPDWCGGGGGQCGPVGIATPYLGGSQLAPVDQGQRAQTALEVPLQWRRDEAAGLAQIGA